ncbi:hypothetical protein U3450_003940 [Bacillus cytotoxicus]|uniref:hypothetical protein n=1 Tax=unclassified Bacillus cereus group TaxID=2750818 RepID=UPI001F5677DE|nr:MULTISPECIES: hypothetical protein [unclassified Bacillus cereus group]EMA6344882.1 hypothetical protein [Bacillus cytotoxicus]
MVKSETSPKKETAKVPEPVLYPVSEIIEQSEQLFHVPDYITAAALRDLNEVDVKTAEKKVRALLKKEVK